MAHFSKFQPNPNLKNEVNHRAFEGVNFFISQGICIWNIGQDSRNKYILIIWSRTRGMWATRVTISPWVGFISTITEWLFLFFNKCVSFSKKISPLKTLKMSNTTYGQLTCILEFMTKWHLVGLLFFSLIDRCKFSQM